MFRGQGQPACEFNHSPPSGLRTEIYFTLMALCRLLCLSLNIDNICTCTVQVRKIRVVKKSNEILNRLNKTKKVSYPDFRAEREKRDREEREDKKKLLRQQREREKEEEKRKKEEAELR